MWAISYLEKSAREIIYNPLLSKLYKHIGNYMNFRRVAISGVYRLSQGGGEGGELRYPLVCHATM